MLDVTPLAYKYVLYVATIAFVNYYAPRLKMPFQVPLHKEEVRLRVRPPMVDQALTLYGCGIHVNNYFWGSVMVCLTKSH